MPRYHISTHKICTEFLNEDLLEFKDYYPSRDLFLDARYWDIVFGDYPAFSTISFKISISDEVQEYHMDQFEILDQDCPEIILIKMKLDSNNHEVYVHNILLVYDRRRGLAIRYNPSGNHDYEELLDNAIKLLIPENTKYVKYSGEEYTQCVASCMYFALAYVFRLGGFILSYDDTRKFMSAVKQIYGKIEGPPLIESGDGFSNRGALIGGLGGGLLGGLIAGPVGLVVGGVGGALIGGNVADEDW